MQFNLPIEVKFDFVLEKPQTEFHPCWSFNKKEWGQGGDGLSWYAAAHRNDHTFRTGVFDNSPAVILHRDNFNLTVGETY